METQLAKLSVGFGKPQYDWLSVELRLGNFFLEFDASGVLDDPLAELVSCLLLVEQGVDASVSWWLEPAEISFQFSIQSQNIRFEVLKLDDADAASPLSKRQLFCLEASHEAIVIPFWRALQKLNPADFNEGNWYPLPLEKLEKLTRLLKVRKQPG